MKTEYVTQLAKEFEAICEALELELNENFEEFKGMEFFGNYQGGEHYSFKIECLEDLRGFYINYMSNLGISNEIERIEHFVEMIYPNFSHTISNILSNHCFGWYLEN
jgi:hypothetical protein